MARWLATVGNGFLVSVNSIFLDLSVISEMPRFPKKGNQ